MLAKELLEILCCPKCRAAVRYEPEKNILTCVGCGAVYQVKDDIPIMLPDENEKRQ